MLNVCTSAREDTLAALGDLLTVLGTTASSSGMDVALKSATAWVERHITNSPGGSIRREVVSETIAGYGSQRLVLSRTPVWAIQRMFDDTSTCSGTEYCSTDYRIENRDAGFIELTGSAGFGWDAYASQGLGRSPVPNAVKKRWLVVYEGGWQFTPSTSTSLFVTTSTQRTLPEDIERAVLLKAGEFYQGSAAGIESMRVGPLSVNYSSESLDPVVELLALYRRF